MTFFELLKEFQTAIVGVVGFTGVITAQFVNASLSRKAEDREIERRTAALRTALLAELLMFRRIFKTQSEQEIPSGGEAAMVPRVKRWVSEELKKDLGLLDRDTLDKAIKGLMIIDESDRKVLLVSESSTDEYFVVSAKSWHLIIAARQSTFERIDDAIRALGEPSARDVARSAKR